MISPWFPGSSSGGMQAGGSDTGTAMFTGDGFTDTFQIPHGLPSTPVYANVIANNNNAIGSFSVSWDATNITFMYFAPPAPGALEFTWIAIK